MKKVLVDELLKWAVAATLGVALIGIFVLFSMLFVPPLPPLTAPDDYQLVRYFLKWIPTTIWGIIAISGALLFIDYITPGNFLSAVEDGNVACAILSSALAVALAMLLCWT